MNNLIFTPCAYDMGFFNPKIQVIKHVEPEPEPEDIQNMTVIEQEYMEKQRINEKRNKGRKKRLPGQLLLERIHKEEMKRKEAQKEQQARAKKLKTNQIENVLIKTIKELSVS